MRSALHESSWTEDCKMNCTSSIYVLPCRGVPRGGEDDKVILISRTIRTAPETTVAMKHDRLLCIRGLSAAFLKGANEAERRPCVDNPRFPLRANHRSDDANRLFASPVSYGDRF